jgi:hypothetical protein
MRETKKKKNKEKKQRQEYFQAPSLPPSSIQIGEQAGPLCPGLGRLTNGIPKGKIKQYGSLLSSSCDLGGS